MKIYFKSILKLIKSNLSRFITIILIIMLGIAFLVGLFSVSPDLKLSYSNILNNANISELYFKTNSIYTDNSIKYINEANLSKEFKIYGAIEEDSLVKYLGSNLNARLNYRDINTTQDKLKLIEGSYPNKRNEVLVEQGGKYLLNTNIGSSIIIDNEKYIISGIVQSPWYLMKERYQGDNGQSLDLVIYLDINNIYNDNNLYKVRRYNTLYLDYINDYNYFTNKNNITKVKEEFNNINEGLVNISKQDFKRYIKDEVFTNIIKGLLSKDETNNIIDKYYKNETFSIPSFLENVNYEIIESELNKDNPSSEYLEIKEYINQTLTTAEIEMIKATGTAYLNYYNTLYESYSMYQFDMYVTKVEDVSLVFPIFFFIITSLVVMSTLRRLIYEERSSIGTLRALGYSKYHIIFRYLIYGLLASFIGSLLGAVIGIFIIPSVVFEAYKTTCHLNEFIVSFDIIVGTISIILMFILVSTIILFSLRSSLKENPNILLTSRPLVKGSKVFLEYIPFIWKHLKFKYKSTIRNMIRYKRNLIMMLVGISGTTGLLLVGFGIKDSINSISKLQFEDILYYDAVVNTNDSSKLVDPNIIGKYDVYYDEIDYDTYPTKVIVADNKLNEYINLNNEFNSDSCIVNKHLANNFKLDIGDKINYLNQEFIITYIMDNYIDNYILIGNDLIDLDTNRTLLLLNENITLEEEKILQNKLFTENLITSITFTSSLLSTFDSLISNLNLIVIVIVLFAAALTFIVVYNLININVCEREREIATLMVLGYSHLETHGYIARETFILSSIGALIGLGVGKLLHMFVCYVIDTPQMYLPRNISYISYLFAFFLTIIFTIIVDLCFIPKYRKISMTESLKAIE